MLHGVLLAGWLLSQAAPSPLSPRSLQATQQAVNNHINDCAQRTIVCATETPVPTHTPVPATAAPVPTATPVPADEPVIAGPSSPEQPCWVRDAQLGDDENDDIVFWPFVDQDGNEDYRPLPCEQAWVLTPAPTVEPIALPPAPPAPAPASPPRQSPPVRASAPPPPTPRVIVVTATPVDVEPTPTRTSTETRAPTPTSTPTPEPTSPPAATPTPTSTPTPVPLTAAPVALPPLPFDWTGVLIVVSTLFVGSGLMTWLVLRQRRHHLAQLAELGD